MKIVTHSAGQTRALGLQGKKADKSIKDINTAPKPTRFPHLTLNGLGISGSFLRKTKKDIATNRNATVTAKLPLLINQTSIVSPKKGAREEITPIVAIATWGV